MIVVATPGVNQSVDEQRGYARRIQNMLDDVGLHATVVGIYWSSQDSAVRDYVRSFLGDFEGHLVELVEGFDEHRGLRDILRTDAGPEVPIVWLAHSWGTVLAHNLKRRCRWLDRLPLLSIGSPLTHPMMRAHLAIHGRASSWLSTFGGSPPEFIVNTDDPITCIKGRILPPLWVPMSGCTTTTIDVVDDGSFHDSHDERHYLSHPSTISALLKLAHRQGQP